jgi:hypothetical protein
MTNKLQFMCLLALEEMTLRELNQRYFDNGGIGYTKKVVAGQARPHELIMNTMCDKFEPKYHEAWEKELEYRRSFKGW